MHSIYPGAAGAEPIDFTYVNGNLLTHAFNSADTYGLYKINLSTNSITQIGSSMDLYDDGTNVFPPTIITASSNQHVFIRDWFKFFEGKFVSSAGEISCMADHYVGKYVEDNGYGGSLPQMRFEKDGYFWGNYFANRETTWVLNEASGTHVDYPVGAVMSNKYFEHLGKLTSQ